MFNITNRTVTIFTIQTNEHHGERTTRLMDWQKATAVVNFASTNIIASLHLNEGSM